MEEFSIYVIGKVSFHWNITYNVNLVLCLNVAYTRIFVETNLCLLLLILYCARGHGFELSADFVKSIIPKKNSPISQVGTYTRTLGILIKSLCTVTVSSTTKPSWQFKRLGSRHSQAGCFAWTWLTYSIHVPHVGPQRAHLNTPHL